MTKYNESRPFYDRNGDGLGRRRSALRSGNDPVTGEATSQSPSTVGRPMEPRRPHTAAGHKPNRDSIFD